MGEGEPAGDELEYGAEESGRKTKTENEKIP